MLKIEVTDEVKQITSRKTGSHFTLQVGYAHVIGAKYPERFEFFAPKAGAIKPGAYSVGPEAVYIADGRMQIDAGRATPVKA